MSKFALISLALTALLGAVAVQLPDASQWSLWCKAGALMAGVVSLALLAAGKRIKFDPILR